MFIADLELQQCFENLLIELISDDRFIVEEAFAALSGQKEGDVPSQSFITAESLFELILTYGNPELLVEDC